MEFINEYGLLIIIILAVILAVVVILNAVNIIRLNRKLSMRKVSFKALQETEVESGIGKTSIITINESMLDISVSAIGVVSKNTYFDFIKEYNIKENFVGERVLIAQRSSIKVELSDELLQATLIDSNSLKKFGKISIYAIDKSGTLSRGKATCIKVMLNKKVNQIIEQNKQAKKEAIAQSKKLKKETFLESYKLKLENKEKTTLKEKIIATFYKNK